MSYLFVKVHQKIRESFAIQLKARKSYKRNHCTSILVPEFGKLNLKGLEFRTKRRMKTELHYQSQTQETIQSDCVIEQDRVVTRKQRKSRPLVAVSRKVQHCSTNPPRRCYDLEKITTGNGSNQNKPEEDSFFVTIGKEIINSCRVTNQSAALSLNKIIRSLSEMENSIYTYPIIEKQLKSLNLTVSEMNSDLLSFKTFIFAGIMTFEYCSYSLSIYYFDQAFRYIVDSNIQKGNLHFKEEKELELVIYRTVARIMLKNGFREDAREFAYSYLRKLWNMGMDEEELSAFDFIGKIENQLSNHVLSKYFHQKMCSGQTEKSQIIKLSNLAFHRSEKERSQLNYFENICEFVRFDKSFNAFLQNHYLTEVKNNSLDDQNDRKIAKKRIPKIILTHKSHNRVTQNYHRLQRRLVKEKSSNELHFVTRKEVSRLKVAISEYSDFISVIKVSIAFIENISRYSLPVKL